MLSRLRKLQFKSFHIAILLAAFLGAAHILIRTSNYGPELTSDTWDYISVAESLAAGDGFKDYLQRTYIDGGPGYPLLLAFFGLLGIDPVDTGRFVNIIGFGLIILLTGYQLNRYVRFRFLAVVGSVAVMTSLSVSRIAAYLMTEILYIVLMLLALIQMRIFLKSEEDSPRFALALSAGFTALAIITRYAGIAVLLTGIIMILVGRNFKIRHKLKYAAFYSSISLFPFGVWMIRNQLTMGTFWGRSTNYQSSLLDYIESFGNLFISDILVLRPGSDWFIYLICTVVCLIIWGTIQKRTELNQTQVPSDSSKYGLHLSLFGLFALISIWVLLFSASSIGDADSFSERLLIPIYVPVIIVALVLLDLLLRRLARKWTASGLVLVCLISTGILGSISLSLRLNIDVTAQALESNAKPEIFETYGYSHDMEILEYLRNNPVEGQAYSNANHLLFWFTDASLGGYINSDNGHGSCLSWVRRLARLPEPSYIVYFTIPYRPELYSKGWFNISFNFCDIQELESNPSMQNYLERIAETPEGIVYQVTAPLGPQPDFNVQINADTLIYTKEQCTSADTEPNFFLHIVPVDMNTLPSHRLQSEFDNLDFGFDDYGKIFNGKCTITVELPHYNISKIRTGQFTDSEGELWETELSTR